MSRKFALEGPTETARQILRNCAIPIGADFHTLPSGKVFSLLCWMDSCGYRKPRNANGSRGRYFHDMMQRRAKRITVADARRNLQGVSAKD